MMERQLPAYPLFLKDPFFSMWSMGDRLAHSPTCFWTNAAKKLLGFIKVDGEVYSFLGLSDAPALKQTGIEASSFKTIYHFAQADFTFDVEFVSPLLPNDLELLSCPVCYLNYRFSSAKPHSFEVALAMGENWCYNETSQYLGRGMKGRVFQDEGLEIALMGLAKQMPLSATDDEVLADWGYFYLMGDQAYYGDNHLLWAYINKHGAIEPSLFEDNKVLMAFSQKKQGTLYIAHDQGVAVQYFNEYLPGYYFRSGKTIVDALEETRKNHDDIETKLAQFDQQLKKDCAQISPDYYAVAVAALRQSIAAHVLVEDKKGELLFLSKECGSNGSIGTVDVAFPTQPLFLLYNPALLNAMLTPIYHFARLKAWPFDFAPHDVGTYPCANGQTYGLADDGGRYRCHEAYRQAFTTTYPHYVLPKEAELYALESQMPLEESANMIIMAYAAYQASGESKSIKENFDLLKKWARFLEEFGYCPSNQLCTDDFAGHTDKNINLSIKACVALECFVRLLNEMGENTLAKEKEAVVKRFVEHFEMVSRSRGFLPLSFEEGDSRYSLKYNLALDRLFGFNLFSADLYNREIAEYKKHQNPMGIPLDSRKPYTKSDWEMWVASFADASLNSSLISSLVAFLKSSPDRWAFPDWFDSGDGHGYCFRNRTVQGGIFFPLLCQKKGHR